MSTTTYTHDEQGHRVDVHRPSSINPGDYDYVGVDYKRKHKVTGGPAGVCHHCGKAIVWEVKWLHQPSGNVVTFGETCTQILGMSNSRIEHEMVLLKRQAENERREEMAKLEKEEKIAKFHAQHPDVAKFLNDLDENESFAFLLDMKRSMEHWGSLTDRQVASVEKCMVARKVYMQKKMHDAMNAPTDELVEGRRTIEGEVLSHRFDHTDFGTMHKMLVKQDDGNKVWGTVAKTIEEALDTDDGSEELKGQRVRFVATVKRSDTDEHYGFFSRPSKGEVVTA